MSDGVYTSFFELPNLDPFYGKTMFNPAPTPRTATFQPVPTSTLDSLMKLKNLAECIDDALETRDTVCKQIEEHIKEHKKANGTVAAASAAKTRTAAVENAMKQTKREVQKLRAESDSMEAKIEERRDSLRNAILALDEERSKLVTQKEDLRLQVQSQRQTIKAISGQVRRIAQKLLDIFPIEPIEGKPLCFTILEHHLPNAKSFENEIAPNEDATAAALGYVCEIVVILEQQLGIPLPYPITSRGSTSDIFDPLSPSTELGSTVQLPKAQLPNRENSQYRIFPLFQKGSIAKRFNWGVYLLNKNIEELMSKNKLKVMDPRNTLANIKYLLTVLSSGTGDMPHRKVGEIKGLSFRSRVLGEVKDV